MSGTQLATLHRLANVEPTQNAMLDATYTGRLVEAHYDFAPIDVAGQPGILYQVQFPPKPSGWSSGLARLAGVPVNIERSEGGALMVVAVDGHVYAAAFGQGYHALPDCRERGFGLRCTLRAVDPDRVREVKRRRVGGLPRQDDTQTPGGSPIGLIGVRENTELVKELGGYIQDIGGKAEVSAVGADGLRLSVPTDPERFVAMLRTLNEIAAREVRPQFEVLEALQPVRDPVVLRKLDTLLGDALHSGDGMRLSLVIPSELSHWRHDVGSYRIKLGTQRIHRPTLDIAYLRLRFQVQRCSNPVTALRDGRIEIFDDAEGTRPLGGLCAIRWIEATTSIGPRIYFLSDGDWYECGVTYLESVQAALRALMPAEPSVPLPPWREGESERDYNERLQRTLRRENYVCLDRKLIKTSLHNGNGFEACDGFTADHVLVHIKAAASSTPLSHLFQQMTVAVQALLHQPEARARFSARVAEASGGKLTVPEDFQPRKVVFGILLKGKELTPDTLYPFSQAALATTAGVLHDLGITVEVVPISEEP